MDMKIIASYLGDDTIDPIQELKNKLQESNHFNNNEVGLCHPIKSSIVKLRDNGMIDIFAGSNVGVRLDSVTKSINFFSNKEKHSTNSLSFWVEDKAMLNIKRELSLETYQLLLQIQNAVLNIKELQLNGNNLNITENNININTNRSNVKINNISMKDMDDRMKAIEDNVERLSNMIAQTNNTLNNHINNTNANIQNLWNALNNR